MVLVSYVQIIATEVILQKNVKNDFKVASSKAIFELQRVLSLMSSIEN